MTTLLLQDRQSAEGMGGSHIEESRYREFTDLGLHLSRRAFICFTFDRFRLNFECHSPLIVQT